MANPYIPRRDADARLWMQSFALGISNDCAKYSLSPAEADFIQGVVDKFVESLWIATAPATRTRGTIINKQNARYAAEQLIQNYYVILKANRGISDDDKVAIGVRPINPGRMKINCPQTCPELNIIACTPGAQTLEFKDTFAETKAKPFGAAQLQLVREIHEGPFATGGPIDARIVGQFTRNPIQVEFDQSHDRKKATYWARWVSRRGETGPWSLPASMSIAA